MNGDLSRLAVANWEELDYRSGRNDNGEPVHPMAEFNARGGYTADDSEFGEYAAWQSYVEHVGTHNVHDAKDAWRTVADGLPRGVKLEDRYGNKLPALLYNCESLDGVDEAIVTFRPFGNMLKTPQLMLQNKLVADETGLPLVVFGWPGIDKENRSSMKESGDFAAATIRPLNILRDNGISKLRLFGHSGGAALVTSMAVNAPECGIEVSHLYISGDPRVAERSIRELYDDFGETMRTYGPHQTHPARLERIGAAGLTLSPRLLALRGMWNNLRFMTTRPAMTSTWTYAKAMTHDRLEHDLEDLLDNQWAVRVALGITSHDSLTPKDTLMRVYRNLHDVYGERVRAFIIPGSDHGDADGEAYPTRVAIALGARQAA